MQPSDTSWFRNAVLYQIYPRSFYDSDNDGVGDLQGIIQKLPYLKGDEDSLDIDAIWLSPIFPSPMADFGYDVSDYTSVDPLFGTIDDVQELIDKAHLRGIKVLLDFIPNHTSDQHQWFKESQLSRDSLRRDWYVWHDPNPEGGPPNNWLSVFGGSAWEFDNATGQYYLHSFLKEQPDLNWENAGLRHAIKQALKFWLDMGVDGFRMDAIYWMSKDRSFRDDPINHLAREGDDPYDQLTHRFSRKGPKLADYMNEIAAVLRAYPEKFMVVEASTELPNTNSYVSLYEHIDPSVSAPFNFTGLHSPWRAASFKKFIDSFQALMRPDYVPVYCMSNHDQPRPVARLGTPGARTSAIMQLTLPGMPIIYYGDELGMDNTDIPPEDMQDPFGLRVPGMGRDPSRTPFQWSAGKNAGFTFAKPWLPINPDYERINVETELNNPHSFLVLYRRLIALRKKYPSLMHGSYRSLELHGEAFIYIRAYGAERLAIVLNFSDEALQINDDELQGDLVFSSHEAATKQRIESRLWLGPHEGAAILLDPLP